MHCIIYITFTGFLKVQVCAGDGVFSYPANTIMVGAKRLPTLRLDDTI
jgi:hypothetical protein